MITDKLSHGERQRLEALALAVATHGGDGPAVTIDYVRRRDDEVLRTAERFRLFVATGRTEPASDDAPA